MHCVILYSGPGQAVGDASLGAAPAPAVATARAARRMRVLLVRPVDAVALRAAPGVKAALLRTQTAASVLEALEAFAAYESEVTAIDELRSSLSAAASSVDVHRQLSTLAASASTAAAAAAAAASAAEPAAAVDIHGMSQRYSHGFGAAGSPRGSGHASPAAAGCLPAAQTGALAAGHSSSTLPSRGSSASRFALGSSSSRPPSQHVMLSAAAPAATGCMTPPAAAPQAASEEKPAIEESAS